MDKNTDDVTRAELLAWLDSKRRHVVQQVEAMPVEARRSPQVPSGWTPLGIVNHLTFDVERVWFCAVMGGERVDVPQGHEGWLAPDDRSDDDILAAYVDECRAATQAVEAMPLGRAPAWWFDDGGAPPCQSLREVLIHVLVETSTHAGHVDICRELADGGLRLVLDEPS